MDHKATLALYLVVTCAAKHVALVSVPDKSLLIPGTMFEGVPSTDAEFYNTYLKFLNSRNHEAYLPIAAASIIIGLVGNICFLYFFGHSTPGLAGARDALYLRRLAGADVLICAVVIPYSVCFESKLIGETILCKAMEYTRHVLTFTSHLLLVSYCQEFTQEDDYRLAEKRLKRSTWIIIAFACVLSCPVLFIFEVGPNTEFIILLDSNHLQVNVTNGSAPPGQARGSDKYSYFRPNFCHMLLNYDGTAQYYEAIKILEVIHSMSFGFVLFASIILVVSKFVQFLEYNPLIGRESMFVSFIETENPEVSQKLQRLSVHERRMSQARARSRTYQFETVESADMRKTGTDPTIKTADLIRSQPTHIRPRSSSVDKEVQGTASDDEIGQPAPSVEQETKTGETGESTPVDTHGTKHGERSGKKRMSHVNESKKSSSLYELVLRVKNRRKSTPHRKSSAIPGTDVSLVKFLCCCECFRSRGKRILRVRESYEKALACLIVLDILIASATIVLYLVSEQRSVALNLIHVKSVFSFYIISFFHSDLRRATWSFR